MARPRRICPAVLVIGVIAGKGIAEVAAERRVAYSTVCKAVLAFERRTGQRLPRPIQGGEPRPKAPIADVVALHRTGLNRMQIGKRLGCTRQYAGQVLAVWGDAA